MRRSQLGIAHACPSGIPPRCRSGWANRRARHRESQTANRGQLGDGAAFQQSPQSEEPRQRWALPYATPAVRRRPNASLMEKPGVAAQPGRQAESCENLMRARCGPSQCSAVCQSCSKVKRRATAGGGSVCAPARKLKIGRRDLDGRLSGSLRFRRQRSRQQFKIQGTVNTHVQMPAHLDKLWLVAFLAQFGFGIVEQLWADRCALTAGRRHQLHQLLQQMPTIGTVAQVLTNLAVQGRHWRSAGDCLSVDAASLRAFHHRPSFP